MVNTCRINSRYIDIVKEIKQSCNRSTFMFTEVDVGDSAIIKAILNEGWIELVERGCRTSNTYRLTERAHLKLEMII